MVAKNQNDGKNGTRVNISAVISPIIIIFSAFIIFPRPRSLILILYLFLEFNMADKIQDGCRKVIQFNTVAKKLPVLRDFSNQTFIYNTIQYKYNLAHAKSVKLIDDSQAISIYWNVELLIINFIPMLQSNMAVIIQHGRREMF